jgi:hypothetical protein
MYWRYIKDKKKKVTYQRVHTFSTNTIIDEEVMVAAVMRIAV